jgi:phosphonoacetate hydrolase
LRTSQRGSVEVNGRRYALPRQPTIAITIDGCDPRYLEDAFERRLMPRLVEVVDGQGSYRHAHAHMPTFTNVNNMSIVTGVPPAIHGISGNHYLGPDGQEVPLDDPELLRAGTIHAEMMRSGRRVLAVTAKDKLRRMLTTGGVPGSSAERATGAGLAAYDVPDLEKLVGRPAPGIYEWEISHYLFEIVIALTERVGPLDLIYLSTTDFVQHSAGPGDPLSDRFLERIDPLIGQLLDLGYLVGITADHGMNDKSRADGSPNVVFLEEALAASGFSGVRVVLPVTDPYVAHHAALGSLAWIWCRDAERDGLRQMFLGLPGIESVLSREEACVAFELPADRIGDLSIVADPATVLGKSARYHDLSVLHGPLRSHGGLAERAVPFIISQPLSPDFQWSDRQLMNSDLHHVLLNGVA